VKSLFASCVLAIALATACGGDEQAVTTQTQSDTGAEELPAIVVETPKPGDTLTSPAVVAGTANVFEANVTVRVLDADGNELATSFTTATCGTGCRGDYSLEIAFAVDHEQQGTIVVHDDDAAGTGTPPHVVNVPVILTPG
jgi:hypothetical protein